MASGRRRPPYGGSNLRHQRPPGVAPILPPPEGLTPLNHSSSVDVTYGRPRPVERSVAQSSLFVDPLDGPPPPDIHVREPTKIAFGWVRRSSKLSGNCRFNRQKDLILEGHGEQEDLLFATHEDRREARLAKSGEWVLELKLKARSGKVFLMLSIEIDESGCIEDYCKNYVALCLNMSSKTWSILSEGTGSRIFGTMADSTLTSKEFYMVQMKCRAGRFLSVWVDGHIFFAEQSLPGLLRGPLGVAVEGMSKAIVRGWAVTEYMSAENKNAHLTYYQPTPLLEEEEVAEAMQDPTEVTLSYMPDKKDGVEEEFVTTKPQRGPYVGNSGKDFAVLETMIESSIMEPNSNVSFDDIASLADAKRLLQEAVVLPMILPTFFTGILKPWKGVLLHGPPGTGKTMLSRALASTAQTTFFNVNASLLVSKWRGESEKLVQVLFKMARHYAPSIVFLDEIDSLTKSRGGGDEHEASRGLKSALFSEIDGMNSSMGSKQQGAATMVMVLATTNRPWDLDEAMRRRLEKRIYIPLPSREARTEIFKLNLKDLRLEDDISYTELAGLTEDFSGADIHLLCRDASMVQLRALVHKKSAFQIAALRNSPALDYALRRSDFMDALKRIRPSVNSKRCEQFEKWQKEFGST